MTTARNKFLTSSWKFQAGTHKQQVQPTARIRNGICFVDVARHFTPTGYIHKPHRVLLSYVSQSVCGHALDRQNAVFCCHSVNGQDCRKTPQRCRNRLARSGSRQVHRQLQWFPYTLSRVSKYVFFVLTDSDHTNHLHMVAGFAARTTYQNIRMQANISVHRGSKVHKPPWVTIVPRFCCRTRMSPGHPQEQAPVHSTTQRFQANTQAELLLRGAKCHLHCLKRSST